MILVLAAIVTVVLLVTLTLMVHYEVLRFASDHLANVPVLPRLRIVFLVFAAFTAHTIEVWIYAIAYYLFVNILGLGSFGGEHQFGFFDYLYFSTVTYTSLGLGDIFPVAHVRLIAGVEALNGLVLIAWTGSFTYLAMERLWHLHIGGRLTGRRHDDPTEPSVVPLNRGVGPAGADRRSQHNRRSDNQSQL